MATISNNNIREHILRFAKFGTVGFSGMVVNMGLLWLFRAVFGLSYLVSGALAIELSIVSNFILNDIWTWRDRRKGHILKRLLRYNIATSFTSFGINYPIYAGLLYLLGVHYLLANLVGIAVASLLNFIINHHWTYGVGAKGVRAVRLFGWILLTLFVIAFLLIAGFLWVKPIQRAMVANLISKGKGNIRINYRDMRLHFGRLDLTAPRVEYSGNKFGADSLGITFPTRTPTLIDTLVLYSPTISIAVNKTGGKMSEEGKQRFPIFRIAHLDIRDGSLVIGKDSLRNVSFLGLVSSNGKKLTVKADSLGLFAIGRGRIEELTGDIELSARLGFTANIKTARSYFSGKGIIAFDPLYLDIAADGDSVDITEIDSLLGMHALWGKGSLHFSELKGNPKENLAMRLSLDGVLYDMPFKHTEGILHWKNDHILTLDEIDGNVMTADIKGSGVIDFTDTLHPTYRFDANVRDLNLATFIRGSNIPSSLTGHIKGSGVNLDTLTMRIELDGKLASGTIWDFPFDSAAGKLRITGDSLHFRTMRVARGENDATISGAIAFKGDMNLTVIANIPNIESIANDLGLEDDIGGRGSAVLQFHYHTGDPSLTATIMLDSLHSNGFIGKRMQVEGEMSRLTSAPSGKIALEGKANLWGLPADSIRAKATFKGNTINVHPLEVWADKFSAFAVGNVESFPDSTRIKINGMELSYPAISAVLGNTPTIRIRGGTLSVDSLNFSALGGTADILQLHIENKKTMLKLAMNGLDIKRIGAAIAKSIGLDIEGKISAEASLMFEDSIATANGNIAISADELTIAGIPWDMAQLYGTIGDEKLDINDFRLFKEDEIYKGSGTIGLFEKDAPLDIKLSGEGTDLGFLKLFSDVVENFSGQWEMNGRVQGTVAAPKTQGFMQLSNGEIKFVRMDEPITNITVNAHLEGDKIILDTLTGSARGEHQGRKSLVKRISELLHLTKRSAEGTISAKGVIALQDSSIAIAIATKQLPISLSRDGFFATVSSSLMVSGKFARPAMSGEVKIPDATIIQLGTGGGGTAQGLEMPVDLSITVESPGNVWLLTKDAEIELTGDLVLENQHGLATLYGELSALRGKYFYLGSTFKLTEGHLFFDDIATVNPRLDISARTNANNIPVDLSITGTLQQPELTLSSTEGYSEKDILFLLTLNQALPSEGDSLYIASLVEDRTREFLYAYLQRGVEQVARKTLGVEKIEITPASSDEMWNVGDYQITVGKYITDKLFLTYSHELAAQESDAGLGEVQMEYRLSDHLSLFGSKEREGNYKLEFDMRWDW